MLHAGHQGLYYPWARIFFLRKAAMGIQKTMREVALAMLPITVLVLVLQWTVLGLPGEEMLVFLAGTLLASVGFILFLVGVEHSLLPIGEMIGSALVAKGTLTLVLATAVAVGFAVTLAEPGLMVLANQAERASGGEIHRYWLAAVVALGVGLFVAMALLKTLLNIPLLRLLLAGYAAIFVLACFTPGHFVTVSLDAGGVATGPVTVPFLLAFGVGTMAVIGGRGARRDSFGYVALASIGPVLAVLILGILHR
jgi:hypothetical protein